MNLSTIGEFKAIPLKNDLVESTIDGVFDIKFIPKIGQIERFTGSQPLPLSLLPKTKGQQVAPLTGNKLSACWLQCLSDCRTRSRASVSPSHLGLNAQPENGIQIATTRPDEFEENRQNSPTLPTVGIPEQPSVRVKKEIHCM